MMQLLMGLGRCIAILLLVGLSAACDFTGNSSSGSPSDDDSDTPKETKEPKPTPTTGPAPTPGPVKTPAPDPVVGLTPFKTGDLAKIPELFEIEFLQGKVPADLTILFNGKDVTDLFEITADGAKAAGATLSEYLILKKNTLTVEADGQSHSKSFTFAPNVLSITSFSEKIYLEPPPTLTINFLNEERPTDFSIVLNGKEVTQFFTGNNFSVLAQGSALEGYYVNGNNNLVAMSGLETDLVSFVYDMLPPRAIISGVDITSGANIPTIGTNLIVNGFIRDVSPVKSLTINGIPATIDLTDNSFTIPVRAKRLMKVVATDINDDLSTQTYLLEGQEHNGTMGVTINQTVMDFALPIVENMMRNLNINGVVPDHRVLRFRGGACVLKKQVCEIAITKMQIGGPGVGPPNIQVRIMPNNPLVDGDALALDIVAKMPEIRMAMHMFSSGWTKSRLPLAKMDMKILDVEFSMRVAFSMHPVTGIPITTLLSSHPMQMDFRTIEFIGVNVACFFFLGDEKCLNGAGLSTYLTAPKQIATFKDLFNIDAAPVISAQFNRESAAAAAPPAGNASTLPAPAPKVISFDTDHDGKSDRELIGQLKSRRVTADEKGNAYLGLTSHFYVEEDKIPFTYPHTLGSVYIEAPEPSFNETSENGQSVDVGMALSVNMLNQFFLAFYQTGVMDTIPVPLTLESLGEMGDLLGIIGYTAGSEFEIRMELGAVPYLSFVNSDKLLSNNSTGIVFQMDNVRVFMYAKLPDGDEFVNILGMLMDIQANIEMDLLSSNYLNMPIRDDILSMKIVDILPEGSMAALVTPDLVQTLMGGLVNGMIQGMQENRTAEPQLAEILLGIGPPPTADQALPIPLPLEVGIIMRQFEVPQQEGYLALSMDLLNEWDIPYKPAADNLTMKVDMLRRKCWAWPGDVCD